MSTTRVRRHVRSSKRGWPYAVHQHLRHRWVLPSKRRSVPFDEVSGVRLGKPTIRYVDPALIVLTGVTRWDRQTIDDFLRSEECGPDTVALRERLREGRPVDAISIRIDRHGVEHLFNGAHRSVAAICAGARRVPVEVYMEDGGPFREAAFRRWRAHQKKLITEKHLEYLSGTISPGPSQMVRQ